MPASSGPKFLVTGATGFIGSQLVSALIAEHGPQAVIAMANTELKSGEEAFLRRLKAQNVATLQCDLVEMHKLNLPVPEFDVLYHLAAYVETEKPSPKIAVNTTGTTNLLNWLGPKLSGKRLVFSGTQLSMDRGSRPSGPMVETSPCHPKTEYGQTKLESERIIQAKSRELHFDWTILRLSTIIGPGFRGGGMLEIFQRLLNKNSLATRLNWPGKTSLIGLADLVDILVAVPKHTETKNEIYLLTNGEDPTVDNLLDQIAGIYGLPRKKIIVPRFLWNILGAVTSFAGDKKVIPFRMRVFLWRVSHMAYDGLYLDGSKINAVLKPKYRTVEQGLREAYGMPPSRKQRP